MANENNNNRDLSIQISEAIRAEIINGKLIVDERLPSEAELCSKFGVSRPTVREALKRLAAQNLIRTQRGATGGAFVKRMSYQDASEHNITTSMLLMSMNDVSFETACQARYTLERACAPLSVANAHQTHITIMRQEVENQADPNLTDESFCASDVAFHRALVDAAANPVLSYQLSGAIEAIEPLMNMLTFSTRSREKIIAHHQQIIEAMETKNTNKADQALLGLASYTMQMFNDAYQKK